MGRIATLLGHYWREDDPSEMNEAMARDWADILEGIPQDALAKACTAYLIAEPRRKPTPGAIYALAKSYIPRPALAPVAYAPPPPREPICSPEAAAEIMRQAGFKPKTFGGSDAD